MCRLIKSTLADILLRNINMLLLLQPRVGPSNAMTSTVENVFWIMCSGGMLMNSSPKTAPHKVMETL